MAAPPAPPPVPEQLQDIRQRIDQIDRELVALLAKRFALTHEVGLLKAALSLPPSDAVREAEKLQQIKGLCESGGLDPEFAAGLFTRIMQEAVHNHRRLMLQ